jgi:predicted acylesterase/phospholipase RssA
MSENHKFNTIVFAGGGSRCLWQAGFMKRLQKDVHVTPNAVAAVSAGSTVAAAFFADRGEFALDYFSELTAKNPRNFYPSRVLGSQAAFPHERMYRQAILAIFDAPSFAKLAEAPPIHVLLTRPPAWLGPRASVLLAFSAYTLEKKLNNPVHPTFPPKLGFQPETAIAQDCSTAAELADLLLSSSSTPPFTPVMNWRNGTALDGGLIDNVPVSALPRSDGKTLVLLSRRYSDDSIPKLPDRLYVQPSHPIPISKWDYTNPSGLRQAFELGQKDAELFLRAEGKIKFTNGSTAPS